jgi:hypothetical protein
MLWRTELLMAAGGAVLLAFLGCGKSATKPKTAQWEFRQSACRGGTERASAAVAGEANDDSLNVRTWRGPCLPDFHKPTGNSNEATGIVRFLAGQDTLYVFHDSAGYNCCSYIIHELERSKDTLDVIEKDTASILCTCGCLFNLRAEVSGLQKGTYVIRLWTEARYMDEDGNWNIRRELLGQSEVTIPGKMVVSVADEEDILFETRCDTLMVFHDRKPANCCSKIDFDFEQHGSLLILSEIDTASAWCKCMCQFDLSARIWDLSPGTYTVQVWDRGHHQDWDGMPDSLIAEQQVHIAPCAQRVAVSP